MTIAGFTLPELSEFDPPIAGEGSIDPMGLAAISEHLADLLFPGITNRMNRVAFVATTAVGAMACEDLVDEIPADGTSTPMICFEWLVLEAMIRRIPPKDMPFGVPGSQKTRAVIANGQRLAAATYLKTASVFGFSGIYKPFGAFERIVDTSLVPVERCAEVVRAWEEDQAYEGFVDAVPGSSGQKLRTKIRDEVRASLKAGRCSASEASHLFGYLAESLNPDKAGPRQRNLLRSMLTDGQHETRAEMARLLDTLDTDLISDLSEAGYLQLVRPRCSSATGMLVDVFIAYELLGTVIEHAFRTLCAISYSLGATPLTPDKVADDPTLINAARSLPGLYDDAASRIFDLGLAEPIEERLGEFGIRRTPAELFELLLDHHARNQANKPPNGKRPWFEPYRNGWIVRPGFGAEVAPELDGTFFNPIRVHTLVRFLRDTRP
jgi:hypothetical protein